MGCFNLQYIELTSIILALRPCRALRPRTHAQPWVIGRRTQNYEIWYLKWRIALEKSIFDEIYQNLTYMY